MEGLDQGQLQWLIGFSAKNLNGQVDSRRPRWDLSYKSKDHRSIIIRLPFSTSHERIIPTFPVGCLSGKLFLWASQPRKNYFKNYALSEKESDVCTYTHVSSTLYSEKRGFSWKNPEQNMIFGTIPLLFHENTTVERCARTKTITKCGYSWNTWAKIPGVCDETCV